ncbi:MAG: N-acetyl sugar amidotransferase [Bacteroidia bacterium]
MVCKRCVLDDTVQDIQFDKNGYCNYCTDYLRKKKSILKGSNELEEILSKLKNSKGKYNCIVGVSGGLDSSFLLYKTIKLGLKPLAVHIDTGWNTEVSVNNIDALTKKFNIDLKTHVLDWEQFKKLQISYLKAGVIDLEFPTDHYYLAGLYKISNDLNIRYILTGNNYVSEGIMPSCWIHNKGDTLNMLDIHDKFGDKTSLNKLPTITLAKRFYYYNIKRIENIFLLNYLSYDRKNAKEILKKECNWREYPVKHGESIFTRFYHRYILPTRFKVDYRKAHLSSLICNSQITREEALIQLESPIIETELLETDKAYVLKKLNIPDSEFAQIMNLPERKHLDFKSEIKIKKVYNDCIDFLRLKYFLKTSNRH